MKSLEVHALTVQVTGLALWNSSLFVTKKINLSICIKADPEIM
jgi:hypothetical protein